MSVGAAKAENRNVKLCDDFPLIGNVKNESAQNIWYGEKAQKIRQDTLACEKLCLITWVSQKILMDKVKMELKLLHN